MSSPGPADYNNYTGRVYVFHSTGVLGVPSAAAASANTVITGQGTGNYFGFSVATADVTGDGYGDVVAGANAYNTGTGRVYMFHSEGSGGVTTTTAASANTVITGQATNNNFGLSVAP